MEGIGALEDSLNAIYKQIEAKKLGNYEKEEVNYLTKIANNKEELLAKNREELGMVLPPEEESGWTISPWMNISEQEKGGDPCDAQTNPLRSQITQVKKQLATVKAQAELQQIIINKTKSLNKISAETAKATANKTKNTERMTNSFNTKIANANKALANIPEITPVSRIAEQQPPGQMQQPDCSKEINSLNNELNNLNKQIAKYTALASEPPPQAEPTSQEITEDIMDSLQGGYPDATGGVSYNFQSKGPLGSQPELEDEGFTTFYGDSDNHWSGYNFDSGGPSLGEDPETMEEERYQVNYSNTLEEEFKSKAQARYFYAKANEKGKEGKKWKKWAKEFADDTEDFDELPEKKEKKIKTPKE